METKLHRALADLGGVPVHVPLRDPILSFSHTFSQKSTRVQGSCPPPNGSTPPTGNPESATAEVPYTLSLSDTFIDNELKFSTHQSWELLRCQRLPTPNLIPVMYFVCIPFV